MRSESLRPETISAHPLDAAEPATAVDAPADDRSRAGAAFRRDRRGTVSRRAMFAGGGAALAAFWNAALPARARTGPPEVSADVDPGSILAKLVRRTTMGITGAELARAQTLGYEAYLEYQLDHTAIDDSALSAMLAPLTTLTMQPFELAQQQGGTIISQLIQAVILRGVFSNRQLFERMVEFWTDHFSIDISDGDFAYLKAVDDRDVIRANALSTFPQILSASAHSPAMLRYLDNATSVAGNPNENYARELLELHTLGVDGGYTQQDVVEVARCLTGWTFYNRNAGNNTGLFRYNNLVHDNGQKIVLGNIIPAGGGMQDGVTVLDILVNHPSTALFIAKKLCRRFLSEDPPQSVVADVAATYTATGGDIKAMIRAMLKPNVLADAEPKYKRPFHILTSMMRVLPVSIASTNTLRTQLRGAGHEPYYWGPPDGYPDTFAHWSGLLLPRWNMAFSLLANQTTGSSVDLASFFAGAVNADQMADRIRDVMFQGDMPAFDRDRIRDYLLPNPPSTTRQRDAIALAASSSGFQWY
ncbi:MAG: DUF1800 domain-containing protein [Phycisphaerales bacterium]